MAYDKKLWDFIQEKIRDRTPQPFENRMMESIKKTFDETQYTIEDVNFKKDKAWHENLFDLSKKIGLSDYYETLYRSCSRAEHGSWYHLKFYHLNEKDEHYEPELSTVMPHVQLIIAANLLCLGAMLDYLKYIQPDEKTFPPLLQRLIDWHVSLSKKRDAFVGGNT